MENITKWDEESLQTYYSIERFQEFQEDEYLDISLVPRLQTELWKAQSRIKELEAEKIRHVFRNQRKCKEENIDPLVDYLKVRLSKERKETKRVKEENSRLKKKIFYTESSANRLRRKRDMLEKVCEELMTRIDELKANNRRLWDEMEEERKMLQMAEMWREERVRVKLMDAKLDLQEKFDEMNWFVEELEKCLEIVRRGGNEEMSLRRCEALIKTVRSMEVSDNNLDFERFEFMSSEDN